MIIKAYINDLDDAELLIRPVPGMNQIAWQLGHLIAAERIRRDDQAGLVPPLPEGFAEAHIKEASRLDDPEVPHAGQVPELWKAQRAATQPCSTAFPTPTSTRPPQLSAWAPTVAAVLNMAGTHALMHSGQFVAVRRKLGKPVVI